MEKSRPVVSAGNGTEKTAENTTNQPDERRKRTRRRLRALRSFLFRLTALVLVLYILLYHVIGLTVMPGADMSPRVSTGDLLLFYRLDRKPKSRDIVVIDKAVGEDGSALPYRPEAEPGTLRRILTWLGFRDPDAPPAQRFVCRVVACPGDTVDISGESGLSVNGNTLIESDIFYLTRPYDGYTEYPVVLGDGEYFVLADKRNGGADSRAFGPVTLDEIRGIVITLLRRNNL